MNWLDVPQTATQASSNAVKARATFFEPTGRCFINGEGTEKRCFFEPTPVGIRGSIDFIKCVRLFRQGFQQACSGGETSTLKQKMRPGRSSQTVRHQCSCHSPSCEPNPRIFFVVDKVTPRPN